MRKINYLSIILLAVILSFAETACNNNEEGKEGFSAQEQEVFNTLIGTWRGKGLLGDKEWIFKSSKEYTLNEYKFNTNTLTSSESGRFTLETKSDGYVYLNVGSAAYAITLINLNSIKIGGTEYNRVGSPANIDDDDNGMTNQDAQYERMLMGTSWVQDKEVIFGDDGKEIVNHNEGTLTFGYDHEWYLIKLWNKYDAYGEWGVKNGIYDYSIKSNNYGDAAVLRGIIASIYFGFARIRELTDSKLILESTVEGSRNYGEFHKVSYREGSKNFDDNESGGGGSSSGEPPYVTSFDFSATKTSITVKFMCNERPTSATVKYGTSSPSKTTSSSISGKQVSATVSGLKSGTKYYFKCTVKNSNGSSTSDTFTAITNY